MPNPTRDALIIAITQYSDLPMPPEMTQLSAGAEQIAQRLETQGGFRVTRLPVTKPGDKEFIDPEKMVMVNELELAIEQLLIPKSDTPPTTALIYFAGHGLQKEIKADRYEGFLATSYANPNEDEWGVSLQWLRQLLEKSPVQQQIVWIDACHSGELFNFTTSDRVHDRGFISSARPHEEAYAEGLLTKALLETLDYTQQLNPWVDHLTLIEKLQIKNQTAPGAQRFQFEKTDKPILLTNKAFDLKTDYKNLCPFKGLESFDFEKNPDDPLYFKGRTELTDELLEKVQTANFLAVFGASGNGKSSVVRAGLLYKLQQTQRWAILPVMTPTADPLKALGTLIGMPAAQLSDFIKQAQTERLVLVIDQFEEIFTLCKNDAQREQFFELLLTAVEQTDNPFSLIIVMRADFLDKCSHHVELAKKIQAHQVIVTPMTAAELEEAIVAPTQQVGLQIEPKLVSEMLADVKGALGSLPLLQYTLKELWKTCATQRLLTYSAYEGLGKIAGTLEQGANGVYQKLSPAEQKTAQRIFIELTQLGEGSPDTRRQLSQQDLVTSLPFESAPVNQVIQKLVAANLVVTDKPKEEQVAIVNIAHEALTQHWGQLREWLDGNRDAIKIQRDIEADAKKWQDNNQSQGALLRGLDLNIATNYTKTHTEKVPLSTLAQDFVKRSVKRQRHYWMGLIGSVVGVMLVLAGIAFYANEQRIVAEEQRQFAQEQQKLADERRIEAENQRQFAQEQQKLAVKQRMEADKQRKVAEEQRIKAENQRELTNLRYQGIMFVMHGEYSKALEYYQQALDISRKIGDDFAESNTLSLIGMAYTSLNQNARALEYFKQAEKIRSHSNDDFYRVSIEFRNIAMAYTKMGQYQEAENYYKHAQQLLPKLEAEQRHEVAGYIDSYTCEDWHYELQRNGREQPIGKKMILYTGDLIVVKKKGCNIRVQQLSHDNPQGLVVVDNDNTDYPLNVYLEGEKDKLSQKFLKWWAKLWISGHDDNVGLLSK